MAPALPLSTKASLGACSWFAQLLFEIQGERRDDTSTSHIPRVRRDSWWGEAFCRPVAYTTDWASPPVVR
jgi:hypothetical protein